MRNFLLILLFAFQISGAQNDPPVLVAVGNQFYCPGTSLPIVSSMTITDPDDTATDAVYIQISTGYISSQDQLTLTGTHPNITTSWDALTGKLTLESPFGIPVSYLDLIAAIEDVVYTNSAVNPSGSRTFSITVGQANFLPSTGHYYQYIPALGITWTAAKTAAGASTYYGLQGYLATVTTSEEAQLTGEQAAGAGWIGGSDIDAEGVWKWMTGPEIGTVFWNGNVTGSTPNFAFWNTSEPNNLGEEHYAHITAPGVGIPGSWNDLPVAGSGGDYQPKGYVVEYGGMAGDPQLNISTSTIITISAITSSTTASRCGSGAVTLSAQSNTGIVNWFASPTGGTSLHTGNDFTTPNLTVTTIFYAVSDTGCNAPRTAVIATVDPLPILTVDPILPSCEGSVTLTASSTAGTISWFTSETDETPVATGTTFTTPTLSNSTTYYVEAINGDCSSGPRTSVTVIISDKPQVTDQIISLCENTIVSLTAGGNGYTYYWPHSNETTRDVIVGQPGIYTVEVTSAPPQSCTAVKTITVVAKFAPIISEVIVDENIVTILTENSGAFEYSVDGINYFASNVFTVEQAGLYTAFVRETNYCGNDEQPFIVLMIPPFFSPNNDTYNDFWTVKGINYYPDATVTIFDRHGKVLKQLSSRSWEWDGTYNARQLPASDYWYVLKIDGFPEKRGHFSLIR